MNKEITPQEGARCFSCGATNLSIDISAPYQVECECGIMCPKLETWNTIEERYKKRIKKQDCTPDQQAYAYWNPGDRKPAVMPKGCEQEYDDRWQETIIPPDGWWHYRYRWPIADNDNSVLFPEEEPQDDPRVPCPIPDCDKRPLYSTVLRHGMCGYCNTHGAQNQRFKDDAIEIVDKLRQENSELKDKIYKLEQKQEPQAEREEWICPWDAGAVPDVVCMAEAIWELQRFAEENRRRVEQLEKGGA
jgi:hypothetical protein